MKRTKAEQARLHRLTTAANKINKRLDKAEALTPGSIYGNELQRLIIQYGKVNGLVRTTKNGIRLSRSKVLWEAIPEGEAEGIILELEALGDFQTVRERARKLLIDLDVEEPDDDDINDLLTGAYDLEADSHAVWAMAYDAALANPKLYEFFQSLFGKERPDEATRWEQTRWLLNELMSGSDGGNSNFKAPITADGKPLFGYNQRADEIEVAARNITRAKHDPSIMNDPDQLAALIHGYAGARYGSMQPDGTFNRADEFTPEQLRKVIRKFFK